MVYGGNLFILLVSLPGLFGYAVGCICGCLLWRCCGLWGLWVLRLPCFGELFGLLW